jgi:hypothetical protein
MGMLAISDDLLAKIVDAAKRRGVAPERLAEDLLDRSLRKTLPAGFDGGRRAAQIRRACEIAAMTPPGVKQTDAVTLLREEREA